MALAYPGPDCMGLYLDGNAPSITVPDDLSFHTATPFQSVTLYLCITNPSLGGVSGWEARVDVQGAAVAPAWTLTAGLDVNSDPNNFEVGIGVSPLALYPNANGSVILADWTGFIGQPTDEVHFYVRRVPGSVSFSNGPGYASPTNAGLLQELDIIHNDYDTPVFCINSDCPSVTTYPTWISVSAEHTGQSSWVDVENHAVLSPEAIAGFDAIDVIADDDHVVFTAPGVAQDLDVDARAEINPYTDEEQWTFKVRSSAYAGYSRNVNLSFTTSSNIAPDMSLHLLDRATSTWQDLQISPSYSYAPAAINGIQERTFDLFLGQSEFTTQQFSIGIDANSGTFSDQGNVAATIEGATDGYDAAIDTPEPPAAPAPSLSLYFPHEDWGTIFGSRFMRDVRAPYEQLLGMQTWTFTVDRTGDFGVGVPVVLDFTPSFGDMPSWLVRLRVHETGEIIDLVDSGWTYSWVPGPGGSTSFDLMVGRPDTPALDPVSRQIESGWSLVGAPLVQPAGPNSYWSILLDDAPGLTYMFNYLPGTGYGLLDPDEVWAQGDGAWLGSDSSFTWNMTGQPDPTGVTVYLDEGWTLVGYPMWFPSDVVGIFVHHAGNTYNWAEAVAANIIGADVVGYDDITDVYSWGTALDTWHGYWFWSNQPGVSLVFNFDTMPTTTLRRWQPFASLEDESNWRLDVAIEGARSSVTLGTCELSADGFDAYQDRAIAPKSPVDVGGPELYFERPEWNLSTGAKVAGDIREPLTGLPRAWDAVLSSPTPGPVTLTWDPATWGGTGDLQVYLPTQNRVVVMSMRATTSVTLAVGAEPLAVQFRTPSATGVEDEAPAAVATLTARPNPFNPQTELHFTSPQAGTATVRIHDLLGRLVAILEAGDIPAGGQGRVTWRGRDAAGREVSSGTYFASLAVDGRGVGEIRKLSLVR